MQNLSKRSNDKTLREAIRAPEGYSITTADSSQVEARVLAWLAGQTDLMQAFADGEDPYCQLASAIYGEEYDTIRYYTKGAGAKLDKEKYEQYSQYRFIGKTGILQLGYGSGQSKLAGFLAQGRNILNYTDENGEVHEGREWHEKECARIVRVYRSKYKNIPRFWKVCQGVVQNLAYGAQYNVPMQGYFGGPDGNALYYDSHHDVFGRPTPGIMLPNGYWLLYPKLHGRWMHKDGTPIPLDEFNEPLYRDGGARQEYYYEQIRYGKRTWKKIYGGLVTENCGQSLAFAILWEQAVEIDKYYPIIANVHDSWAVAHQDEETARVVEVMEREMRRLPDWIQGVPIDCESSTRKDFVEV